MFGKKKLKAEIVELSYRVRELENLLCPCESHDWKRIGIDFVWGYSGYDTITLRTYKCKRCGKYLRVED